MNDQPVDRGELLTRYFIEDKRWIHRVVHQIVYEPDELVNSVKVSLDMSLPDFPEWKSDFSSSEKPLMPVPLGLFAKDDSIESLDVTLDGTSLAVLTAAEGTALTKEMLGFLTAKVFPGAEEFSETSLSEKSKTSADAAHLFNLKKLTTSHFLLFVLVPQELAGQRKIIKYMISGAAKSSQEGSPQFLGFQYVEAPLETWWDTSSFHFSFTLPKELVISQVEEFRTHDDDSEETTIITYNNHVFYAHLSTDGDARPNKTLLKFKIVPAQQAIRRWNWALTLVFALGMLISYFAKRQFDFPDDGIFRALTPLILAAPALMIAWLARSREHPLVAQTLAPLRTIFLLQSIVLYSVAVLLAVRPQPFWEIAWNTLYGFSALIVLYAVAVHFAYAWHKKLSSRQRMPKPVESEQQV